MSIENLNLKCRICLNAEKEMNPLFKPFFTSFPLADLLKSIANVEINDNVGMPQNICGTCTKTILNFNDMLKIFQESQEYFQKLVCKKEEVVDENEGNQTLANVNFSFELPEEHDNVSVCDYDDMPLESYGEETTFINEIEDKITEEVPTLNECKIEIDSIKYSCEECGDCFLIKSGFSQHMMQKHNVCVQIDEFQQYSSPITIKIPEVCSTSVLKFVPKNNPVRKISRFQCQICKSVLLSSVDLKLHYNIHKTHKCEHCDAAFIKNSYLKDHLLVHSEEKKYVCTTCGKAFKYRNGLSAHKFMHVNFRGFICEACGQGFNARSTLQTHIKLKHTNEKKYPCSECDLCFKEKSWLDKHFLRKHTNNRTKDFVCSVCGIAYLNKYTLTRHISDKHTGTPKRYYCTICEKSYTMRNKLNTHMQKKHFLVVT